MKYKTILLLLMICSMSNAKNSFSYLIHGGMGEQPTSWGYTGGDKSTLKPMGFMGVNYQYEFNSLLALRAELITSYQYNHKEVNYSNTYDNTGTPVTYTTDFTWNTSTVNLSLPIMIGIKMKRFRFNAGLQFSKLMYFKGTLESNYYTDGVLTRNYKRDNNSGKIENDWGTKMILNYSFNQKIALELAYYNALGTVIGESNKGFFSGLEQFTLGMQYRFWKSPEKEKSKMDQKTTTSFYKKGISKGLGLEIGLSAVNIKSFYEYGGALRSAYNEAYLMRPVYNANIFYTHSFSDSSLFSIRTSLGYSNLEYRDQYSDDRSMFGDGSSDTFSIHYANLEAIPQVSLQFKRVNLTLLAGIRASYIMNANIKGRSYSYCYVCDDEGYTSSNSSYNESALDQIRSFNFGPVFGGKLSFKVNELISLQYSLNNYVSLNPLFKEGSGLEHNYNIVKMNWLNNAIALKFNLL